MRRFRRKIVAVLCAAVLSAATVAEAHSQAPAARGSIGAGDPYFPYQGNGGYNVSHYRLWIRYTPAGHKLRGVATIEARAKQRLSRFDLDLRRNMKVSAVSVNGRIAAHAQPRANKQELVITPPVALRRGHRFRVVVRYSGVAAPMHDPDGSLDGWIPTKDGAFVADEPQGAPTWFPVNDSPRDKATYTVSVNVPKGLVAVSNGKLQRHRTAGRRTTWRWALTRPVSSYLVTAAVGRYDVSAGTTKSGIPYFIAIDPTVAARSAYVPRALPRILDYFTRKFGAYPFGQSGAIIDNAPSVGYALETATRPIFDHAPDQLTLAHELAHQWYGDTVTLKRWRDIWVNEGFAEFSSWLWDEHTGGTTGRQHLRQLLAVPASDGGWNPPPANPGSAARLFANSVYDRGAGTLQALREKVGNRMFFVIMRGWLATHRYRTATTSQFTRYASAVTRRDLSHFFHRWLYRRGKP